MSVPIITLHDGRTIPQLGLGVWKAADGQEVASAVETAIQSGYRLIDTAARYANEAGVGAGIKAANVPREELFITTKLWNTDQGADKAAAAFEASLQRLGLDYVDLYLIHWPMPQTNLFVETWKELQKIQQSGRAKSIGVCNFRIEDLERLQAETNSLPVINQIELHPYFQQKELRDYCSAHHIQVESWSPIGGSGGNLLEDPVINDIAKKHSKSPAQVVIRWHTQLGLVVIPKSVHPQRIQQNIDVFDFELDQDDLSRIEALDRGQRLGPDPSLFNL